MKTISMILFLFGSICVYGQTQSDVFNSSSIVYYGLDFSNVRLIGSEGFTDPTEIKNRFFRSWNHLLLTEKDKYDLKEAFSKTDVEYDLDVTDERNTTPNVEDLVINQSYRLEESKIPGMVKQYKYDQTDGIGLVFIIESFNKTDQAGTLYVTFFDIATKKTLLVKKMGGKPGGFGLRNYWAAVIYDVLKDCKKEYPKWAKVK